MTIDQKIISYLHSATKGVVKICPATAAYIIDLVLQPGKCKIILRRYNYQQSNYEAVRTVETTPGQIEQLLLSALDHKPIELFYRYDLYNEHNELQGFIYTINANLI